MTTMAPVAPTQTWSLDSTASTTVSIAKDVIRAATSDNVQALALIACEKFGATLAMCPETNKKMEDLIIKVSGPKFVRFMSAQIGYSANDCATQLSRSLAGVQFLGLAAALVCSVGTFEGADALSVMLMTSASDKTLLPTARQLKDLLGVMGHRINRSGFTDLWVGYQILIHGGLSAFYESKHYPPVESCKQPTRLRDFMHHPEPDGVSKLVGAFRELNRLGEATAITIRATSCAPWVIAFTRWCLGIPPSTYLPDGKALLDQPASCVTLFTSGDENASAFEIIVQRSIGSPADLLSEVSPRYPSGMVTVECFGRMMCQEIGGESSEAYRAMYQALPYALKQCCHLLVLLGDHASASPEIWLYEFLENHVTKAFPQDFVISNVLTQFLGLKDQQHLKRLTEGNSISDLPLVQLHLRHLVESCACADCKRGSSHESSRCNKEKFLSEVSLNAADILALSLFEGPDTLLVRLDPFDRSGRRIRDGFRTAIYDIIKSGKPAACEVKKVLAWALGLVGHSTEDVENSRWVISCSKGQIVYPRVFETGSICQPGYLVLSWAPGLLFFDGETYDRGVGPEYNGWIREIDAVSMQPSRDVTEPLNLVPNIKMVWKVIRRDGYLEVSPVCGHRRGHAFNILLNLMRSLILRGCPHDSASPLEKPDKFAKYKGPIDPGGDADLDPRKNKGPDSEMRIGVVAVDGNPGLQMFAMSGESFVDGSNRLQIVIRNDSCLQCCLDLCRKARIHLLLC